MGQLRDLGVFGGPPGGRGAQAEPRALSRILMHGGSTNKSTKVASALIPGCLGQTSHMRLTCWEAREGVCRRTSAQPCPSDLLPVLVPGPG